MAITTGEVALAGIAGTLFAGLITPLVATWADRERRRHEGAMVSRAERREAYSAYLRVTNQFLAELNLRAGRRPPDPDIRKAERLAFVDWSQRAAEAQVVASQRVRDAMNDFTDVITAVADFDGGSDEEWIEVAKAVRPARKAFLEAVDADLALPD